MPVVVPHAPRDPGEERRSRQHAQDDLPGLAPVQGFVGEAERRGGDHHATGNGRGDALPPLRRLPHKCERQRPKTRGQGRDDRYGQNIPDQGVHQR